MISEKMTRWNRFIDTVCSKDMEALTPIQKNAVLCFRYDAEMHSGGHSGYFDCYPEVMPQALFEALCAVATREIAENFMQARCVGSEDEYRETDAAYYAFAPSLGDLLERYVALHEKEILI